MGHLFLLLLFKVFPVAAGGTARVSSFLLFLNLITHDRFGPRDKEDKAVASPIHADGP
jgi:hypothetical protein